MKKVIHEEKFYCDVCGKEVETEKGLKKHSVIGSYHTLSSSYFTSHHSYKDYSVEMCEECEEKLANLIYKNFAEIYMQDYDTDLHVKGKELVKKELANKNIER